jgi:hypothetical protein
MQRVGEHSVASGPLAARWLAYEAPVFRAGALAHARVELENAGSEAWTADGRFSLSYHWLDERGNAIVWDGERTGLERDVGPGGRVETAVAIRALIPPGRYRLAVDVVDEGLAWFGELGSRPLELDVDVVPRIEHESEAVAHLGDAVPAPDWAQRVFAAHQEGYAVVGGSIDVVGGFLRRRPAELAPWAPGSGRNPSFPHPLVCPSVIAGIEVEWTEVAGLPAARPPQSEPSLYDGRITARLPSGRPRG